MKILSKCKLIVLVITMASSLFADEFLVKSFSKLENDLSARKYIKYDINGDACALIKVRTDIDAVINFDSNTGIPVEPELKAKGEYWVYVVEGERALKCMADGFMPLTIPLNEVGWLKSMTVYEMRLTSKSSEVLSIEKDLYTLTFLFNVSGVDIQKQNSPAIGSSGSTASYELEKGKYHFMFSKEGYRDLEKTLTVNGNSQIEIDLSPGASSYADDIAGIVILESDPSGAEIYLNDRYMGMTPYQGELKPGTYDCRISKDFFDQELFRFEVSSGMVKQVPEIKLVENAGYLSITTAPEGADICLDGRKIGNSPLEGFQVQPGEYELTVTKRHYVNHTESITLEKGREIKRNIPLRQNFGSLEISCRNTDSALVYIDGNFFGKTPLRIDTLDCGEFDVEISKDLYKHYKMKKEIHPGKNTENVVLLPNFGELSITAEASSIYLNNKLVGNGNYSTRLLPGSYQVKTERGDSFKPMEKTVFIAIGDKKEMRMDPVPITGKVAVMANPVEAMGSHIYINGIVQEKKTPAILTLTVGEYNIKVEHPDYLENEHRAVKIEENAYIKEIFQMKTYTGSLYEKEDFWKKQKWIALGGSVFLGSAGGAGGHYLGEKAYSQYLTATSSQSAANARNRAEIFLWTRDISCGVSLSGLIYAGYAFYKEMEFAKLAEAEK